MTRFEAADLPGGNDACLSLVFDGVDSAFACWLNGQYLGYSQDSRLPAEFDISGRCVSGQNTLCVQVCSAHSDMWLFCVICGWARAVVLVVVVQEAAGHGNSLQVMKWSDGSYLEDQVLPALILHCVQITYPFIVLPQSAALLAHSQALLQ